jgi:hypothetical protein
MLAFSELDGVRTDADPALSRLSRATGDLCMLYLSVTENADIARRYAYAYALNVALKKAYPPVSAVIAAKDTFATKRYLAATSSEKNRVQSVKESK